MSYGTEMKAGETSYRPEIDGLRAIAILIVVLYHYKLGFSGGYVGVDVFFVISGNLITSLLFRELSLNKFTFTNFFSRRIRRLAPALYAMNLACLLTAGYLFLPEDFITLAKSLIAETFLLSNVYFWKTIEYFGDAAHTSPLLHTWSLAVEEQFYLFYPVLLLLCYRLARGSRERLWSILAAGALLSLVLCVLAQQWRPDASFYLLPTRAWELLLGGLVALRKVKDSRPAGLLLPGLGMLSILASGVFFDQHTAHPGLATLTPTLGTAALLATSGSAIHRHLSHRTLEWIGKISYSFYLLHWPVYVFASYWQIQELSLSSRCLLLLLSLVLAHFSWRFVEEPVRRMKSISNRGLFSCYVLGSIVWLLSCGWILQSGGLPQRVPSTAVAVVARGRDMLLVPALNFDDAVRGRLGVLGNSTAAQADFLVWGDSHARCAASVIDEIAQTRGVRGYLAWHNLTPPLLGWQTSDPFSLQRQTEAYNDAILRFAQANHIKKVLLVGRWSVYFTNPEALRSSLEKTLKTLQASGIEAWILLEVPCQDVYVPRAVARGAFFGSELPTISIPEKEHEARTREVNRLIFSVVGSRAVVLNSSPLFRDSDGNLIANKGPDVFYVDSNHLTRSGARKLTPLFSNFFQGNP